MVTKWVQRAPISIIVGPDCVIVHEDSESGVRMGRFNLGASGHHLGATWPSRTEAGTGSTSHPDDPGGSTLNLGLDMMGSEVPKAPNPIIFWGLLNRC